MRTQQKQLEKMELCIAEKICKGFLISLGLAFMLTALCIQNNFANNVQVANITLTGQDVASHFTLAQFDISWENSWRTSTLESNWDAAWVFIKYRKTGAILDWHHATLNYVDGTGTGDGHTVPAGATIKTSTDGKGVFIYRNADGIGNVNFTGAQLQWNYGADGLADGDSAEICVFAIEMVYVPQGSFYLGDGTTTSIQGQFHRGDNTTIPFYINSEGARTLGGVAVANIGNNNQAGEMVNYLDDFNNATTRALPAAFPKGYNAFYCMKYEITNGEYVEFLNKLTSPQETNRYSNYTLYRENIAGSWPNHTTTVPYRANGHMSFSDVAAYIDWAALRPMTEFEYEKACRGVDQPVLADEWASGQTTASQVAVGCAAAGDFTNDGTSTETATLANANCRFNCTNATYKGPMRVGCFARAGTLTRDTTGATYYGIMEMSGNVWETVVTVGNTNGRAYTGVHGDGELVAGTGYSNVANWPLEASTNWGVFGWGLRGGDGYNSAIYTRVSSRYVVGNPGSINYPNFALQRPWNNSPTTWFQGGRGVRTAP